MFDVGTKVVVFTSTAKKGQGPRTGSLGYISDTGNGYYVDVLGGLACCKTEVVFTRYGFEEDKPRHERRPFLNIFPVIREKMGAMELEAQLKERIRAIMRGKFIDEPWMSVRRNLWSDSNKAAEMAQTGIMVPVIEHIALDTCSKGEFWAWFDAYLMNPSFRSIVGHMSQQQITPVQQNVLQSLRSLSGDRDVKRALMNSDKMDRDSRMSYIRAIRMIMAVHQSRVIAKEIAEFKAGTLPTILKVPPFGSNTILYAAFFCYIYSIPEVFAYQNLMRELGAEDVNALLDAIEFIKAKLKAFSSPLVWPSKKKKVMGNELAVTMA